MLLSRWLRYVTGGEVLAHRESVTDMHDAHPGTEDGDETELEHPASVSHSTVPNSRDRPEADNPEP